MEFEILLKLLLVFSLGFIIQSPKITRYHGERYLANYILSAAFTILPILIKHLQTAAKNPESKVTGFLIVGLMAAIIGAGILIGSANASETTLNGAVAIIMMVIGIGVGFGFYTLALLSALFYVILCFSTHTVSTWLYGSNQISAYLINIEDNASTMVEVKKILSDLGIKYKRLKLRKIKDGYMIEIALSSSKNKDKSFIERVMQLQGVIELTSESF